MFDRPNWVKPNSPVSKIMDEMEAGDIATIEKHYAYFMMNMGGMGVQGRIEDGDIAEYLAQFDEILTAADDFPKPQRRDGKEPCGECRLSFGETCDICGAVQKERTFAGIPLSEHARSGPFGWHPGDDA